MQEEVENRTLTLVVSGTKFTGRLMKAAITKYLAHRKDGGFHGRIVFRHWISAGRCGRRADYVPASNQPHRQKD